MDYLKRHQVPARLPQSKQCRILATVEFSRINLNKFADFCRKEPLITCNFKHLIGLKVT